MAIAAAAFAPPPPMDPTDKQKYRTRLASAASSPTAPLNLQVSVGAHNLRILKKAGSSVSGPALDTPRSTASTPTPTGSKQRKYERKSKRFLWPDELHRLFVAAIFDVGLKNASPKALLSIMLGAGASSELTTEHLKSHLQKYRLNYERSRLEFLEFYDESARRSHKRSRRSAGRSGGVGDHNSGFVFPISHKRKRASRSGDGSSDEGSRSDGMSDTDDQSPSLDDSPRGQHSQTSEGVSQPIAPTEVKSETHSVEDRHQGLLDSSMKAADLSAQTPIPQHGSQVPAIQSSSISNRVLETVSDSIVAAAAAAAVASVPYPQLTPLNDPQWNILNSLISPQLGASRGSGESAVDASVGLAGGFVSNTKQHGSFEPLTLSGSESADLQVQMHLAMQAQMNLHRQMLTRKVEVSQHLQNQQQLQHQKLLQVISKSAPEPSNFSWASLTSATILGAESRSAPSSKAVQRPATESDHSSTDGVAVSKNSVQSGSVDQPSASTASMEGAAPSSEETSVSSTLLGLQAADFADAAALASLEGVPSERLDEGDSLTDLYRWDKMDFSMDLEDDDLFGFLKS